jgi:hypothetical protein
MENYADSANYRMSVKVYGEVSSVFEGMYDNNVGPFQFINNKNHKLKYCN